MSILLRCGEDEVRSGIETPTIVPGASLKLSQRL